LYREQLIVNISKDLRSFTALKLYNNFINNVKLGRIKSILDDEEV